MRSPIWLYHVCEGGSGGGASETLRVEPITGTIPAGTVIPTTGLVIALGSRTPVDADGIWFNMANHSLVRVYVLPNAPDLSWFYDSATNSIRIFYDTVDAYTVEAPNPFYYFGNFLYSA